MSVLSPSRKLSIDLLKFVNKFDLLYRSTKRGRDDGNSPDMSKSAKSLTCQKIFYVMFSSAQLKHLLCYVWYEFAYVRVHKKNTIEDVLPALNSIIQRPNTNENSKHIACAVICEDGICVPCMMLGVEWDAKRQFVYQAFIHRIHFHAECPPRIALNLHRFVWEHFKPMYVFLQPPSSMINTSYMETQLPQLNFVWWSDFVDDVEQFREFERHVGVWDEWENSYDLFASHHSGAVAKQSTILQQSQLFEGETKDDTRITLHKFVLEDPFALVETMNREFQELRFDDDNLTEMIKKAKHKLKEDLQRIIQSAHEQR